MGCYYFLEAFGWSLLFPVPFQMGVAHSQRLLNGCHYFVEVFWMVTVISWMLLDGPCYFQHVAIISWRLTDGRWYFIEAFG